MKVVTLRTHFQITASMRKQVKNTGVNQKFSKRTEELGFGGRKNLHFMEGNMTRNSWLTEITNQIKEKGIT